jgi:hypothetical protein
LGLDVAVADSHRMNVSKRTEKLVHIQFDLKHRHRLLELCVVTTCTIYSLWYIFEN